MFQRLEIEVGPIADPAQLGVGEFITPDRHVWRRYVGNVRKQCVEVFAELALVFFPMYESLPPEYCMPIRTAAAFSVTSFMPSENAAASGRSQRSVGCLPQTKRGSKQTFRALNRFVK